MNPNSGQRMFRPTLLPMSSMQQKVMSTGGGVFTTGTINQPIITRPVTSLQPPLTEHTPHTQPMVIQQHSIRPQRVVPKANLYLCNTSSNASDPPIENESESKDKVSLNDLKTSFKDFESQDTKDSLSSFLPHIPGEFDRMPPDTMLRQLLEQRSIGGKNFSPLSGQALLGFRLLPGPLPEMYRIDPPSVESKPHKKRKHKHKNIEKGEQGGDINNGPPPPPPSKIKLPSDAYSFIKQDISTVSTHIAHAPGHMTTHSHSGYLPGGGGDVSVGGVIKQHQPAKEILSASFSPMIATSVAPAPVQLLAGPGGTTIIDPFGPKKPKKPKKEKRKREKGEKKEKKKKKHHSQDPTGLPPSLHPHTPKPFNQFPNT